jgi:hypothetical protein
LFVSAQANAELTSKSAKYVQLRNLGSSAMMGSVNLPVLQTFYNGQIILLYLSVWRKPFGLLIAAAVWFLFGIIGGIGGESAILVILGVIVAIVCLVLYVLKKNLFFGFYNGGDHPIAAMHVKRSVIEGMALDLDKFEHAAALLNEIVLESQKRSGQAPAGTSV